MSKVGICKFAESGHSNNSFQVRCSGEKSGCVRCQSLGYECVYTVSRVGRNPGSRNKNKLARTTTESSGFTSPVTANGTLDESALPSRRASSPSLSQHDSFVDWLNPEEHGDIFFPPTTNNDSESFEASCDLMASLDSRNNNVEIPGLLTPTTSGFNLEVLQLEDMTATPDADSKTSGSCNSLNSDTSGSPSTQNKRQRRSLFPNTSSDTTITVPTASTRGYAASIPTSTQSGASHDCIVACTKVMAHLETFTQKDPLPLDKVMHINKAFVAEISRIISLGNSQKSACCPLLVSVTMDQMITLFETSFNSQHTFNPQDFDTAPQLCLGSFQIDAEEHVEMRARIICREIRKCKQTLGLLAAVLRGPDMQQVRSLALHQKWAGEMARRLENLVMTVGDVWR